MMPRSTAAPYAPAVPTLSEAESARRLGAVGVPMAPSQVVDSADAAADAAEQLGMARPEDGDVGVLVAPMVSGNRELIAGLHRDPQFGMTVMLGVGGVLAEAIGDVAFRLVPL